MRQIKFRIWMNGRYNDKDEWIHIDCEGNICWPYCCNEDCGPQNDLENYFVEQFTGLHDKNGNPIFEGDILKVTHPVLGIKIDVVNYNCEEISGFKVGESYLVKFYDNEIIGNIHENPELLECKNATF